MIKANNIHKKFGNLEILKNISLEVPKKQILTITGKSGAGKTTLLQVIGTLLKPENGEIFINEENFLKFDDKKLSRFRNQNIGFVFQFHHLLPEFTALENVCIPAIIAGNNLQKTQQKAKELLSYFGLNQRFEHKPSQLSGGEQQRVAVARALINNPAILLADEPSGNLDTANKNELHSLFFKLREEFGYTIIIVTHDEQLAQISDRTIMMEDGQIKFDKNN